MYRQERMKYVNEINGLNEQNGRKERSELHSNHDFSSRKQSDTLGSKQTI